MRILLVTCMLFVISCFGVQDGEDIYKKCRGCHGIDGKHLPFERANGFLIGRDKTELLHIIKDIHYGSYKKAKINKIMQKVISKLSIKEIESVAEYISKFKK